MHHSAYDGGVVVTSHGIRVHSSLFYTLFKTATAASQRGEAAYTTNGWQALTAGVYGYTSRWQRDLPYIAYMYFTVW